MLLKKLRKYSRVSHHPFTSDLSIGEFVFCHPLKGFMDCSISIPPEGLIGMNDFASFL